MNSLQLISSKKELFLFSFILLFIFLFNIIHEYFKYKDFTSEELFQSKFQITNIYDKEEYYVVKLKDDDISFFTSISKEKSIEKLQYIHIGIITTRVNFISYLKGFYAKSIYYDLLPKRDGFKTKLYENINSQHSSYKLQELFNALFLAIPISKENRAIYTDFGISHLIAISGFHLGIISFVVYWLVYFPYSYFHKNYFIYRNKRADILIFTMCILLFYLVLTDIVPSLLRAFIMLVLAFLFLRSNIKVFSFQTLLFTLLLIIALFPKYLFSISLWFSIIGVFYIFLYIQYFQNLPRVFAFVFFNFWIFFVFNPIVHFFFYNTNYEQLISPFITLLFTVFYPFELLLHLFGFGSFIDEYILLFVNYKMAIFDVVTPLWFFIIYILISLGSIFDNRAFVLLNILLILFNIYLYL